MGRKYTDKDILREYPYATSVTDLIRRLGLKQSGGSHSYLKKKIKELGLEPLKINRGWNKGKKLLLSPRIPDKDIFCNPTKYKSPSKVKQRALNAGILENRCYICGQEPFWNGQDLVMILDHIDGDNQNNLPENLRIVCPNCNIQLPTSRGKNIRRKQ